jgi:hypothetical protein
VNSDGSIDARARFLAAVDTIADHQDGAGRLCAACVLALPVQRAGIVLNVSGIGLEVLAASDQVAERIEWIQVTLGEGPAVESISRGLPISVPDLKQAHERWPMFFSEVTSAGLGGMYALPLQIGAIKVGALDLYSAAGAPLGATDFAEAIAISELVTAVLLNSDRDGRVPGSLEPWWNQPLSTREVHQATGMVMAQLGVDARSAYVQLQAFAFGNSRLLRDVASDVVNRRKRFHPDPDGDLAPEQEAPTC